MRLHENEQLAQQVFAWMRANRIHPAEVPERDTKVVSVDGDTIVYASVCEGDEATARLGDHDYIPKSKIDPVNPMKVLIFEKTVPLMVAPNAAVAQWLATGQVRDSAAV